MRVETSAYAKCREFRLLPALAFVTFLAATATATAQRQAETLALECAAKDLNVVTLIEEHGVADDLPAERLGNAAMMLVRARAACYEGHVDAALALYDGILALGPVASLREKTK